MCDLLDLMDLVKTSVLFLLYHYKVIWRFLHGFLLSDNVSVCLGRDRQFCPQACFCSLGQVLLGQVH